jgi:hypothetical protein
LSLPHRLRYVLAWDHALCRTVSGAFVRAVLGSLRRRARQAGVPGGRGGAVAIIQRFGAALNLNVHIHALVLDGVYVEDGGSLLFHEAMPPTDEEMDRLLGTIDSETRHRPDAPRAPPCDGRRSSGRRPAPYKKTARSDRAGSGRSETARTHPPGTRSAGSPGTPPR